MGSDEILTAADNEDEMYSSYISKGRLVSMDEMLWGTGDCDYLDDNYVTVEIVLFDNIHSWDQSGVEERIGVEVVGNSGNGDYEHILSIGDEKVFCAQELQDSSDIEFGYNSCDSEDIVLSYGLASKLNGIMIIGAVIRDYYRATMTLKRIYQEKTKFYGHTHCRYWFDRGKNGDQW